MCGGCNITSAPSRTPLLGRRRDSLFPQRPPLTRALELADVVGWSKEMCLAFVVGSAEEMRELVARVCVGVVAAVVGGKEMCLAFVVGSAKEMRELCASVIVGAPTTWPNFASFLAGCLAVAVGAKEM